MCRPSGPAPAPRGPGVTAAAPQSATQDGGDLSLANPKKTFRIRGLVFACMFLRLAEQYRSVVLDLVLSLQALATCLSQRGWSASCYVCGDGQNNMGASFMANLADNHAVRFLVSDFGISWVESRDGHELVKFEGADAIQELQRVAQILQTTYPSSPLPEASPTPLPLASSTSG